MITLDGEEHIVSKIERQFFYERILVYIDNTDNFYLVDSIDWERICVNSAAQYFTRVADYFICTVKSDETNKYKWALEDAYNKITNAIQAVDKTIYSHLDSNNENITVEFLRTLYAKAKGLREAQGIITEKLQELNKENNNA